MNLSTVSNLLWLETVLFYWHRNWFWI